MKRIAIVGAGGMARDALLTLDALGISGHIEAFYESDAVWRPRCVAGIHVRPLSELGGGRQVLIAFGNGAARENVITQLPSQTHYPTFVHPSAIVGRSVEIGEGGLVCAGSILTCDIRLGRHVQLNIGTTIAHDCVLGDFVTTAPGVRISGNCEIGRLAFLGTNSCLRDKIRVAQNAVVGMGAVVVTSIGEGVWIGNPARRAR